jgi:hypothetical protein
MPPSKNTPITTGTDYAIATGTDYAIATVTDYAIASLASLDATSSTRGWTGFATTGRACTAYTASIAAASVPTTHGIASSLGRIGNACRTGDDAFAHAASPASGPSTFRRDAFSIATIPIAAIASAAITTAAAEASPRRLGTLFALPKQYHHKMYFYCWFCNFK